MEVLAIQKFEIDRIRNELKALWELIEILNKRE